MGGIGEAGCCYADGISSVRRLHADATQTAIQLNDVCAVQHLASDSMLDERLMDMMRLRPAAIASYRLYCSAIEILAIKLCMSCGHRDDMGRYSKFIDKFCIFVGLVSFTIFQSIISSYIKSNL